jgi:hypothetical protein
VSLREVDLQASSNHRRAVREVLREAASAGEIQHVLERLLHDEALLPRAA